MSDVRELGSVGGLNLLAVASDEHEDWFVLVSPVGELRDLWLFVDTCEEPEQADVLRSTEEVTCKLCALLGWPLERFEDDPFRIADWQVRCTEALAVAPVRDSFDRASFEDLLAWRESMENCEPGVLLHAALVGGDPRVVNN